MCRWGKGAERFSSRERLDIPYGREGRGSCEEGLAGKVKHKRRPT